MSDIKNRVFSSLIWKFAERISAQLVTFVVSIVLARLLDPSHYGVIAIVNIFIALANVFVVSGFGNSLIQKKDADDTDFSSVFYFNILMSIVLYILVFMCAPVIASFYNMPILSPVLRVMGLRLIVAGINSVQHAYVSKKMLFKRFFWSTLGGTLTSGVIGIIMAYQGFGIWALVAQYMVNTTVDTIVLWFTVKWRPKLLFSFDRLKSLFSFGWKLLASSLLNTIYLKFRSLFIGKFYTPTDLSFYSKGEHFPSLIVTNINSAIQSVIFPVMSNCQDKKDMVKAMMRRAIKTSSYIMFPMMTGLAVIAEPFVKLILTEKWLPCVPYLQLSCIVYAFMPIHTANLQAISAMGRSDIFLKLEIIKKVLGIGFFFVVLPHGVMAIAICGCFTSCMNSIINAAPNRKLLNYSYWEQICDLMPAIVMSIIMGVIAWSISLLKIGSFPLMVAQISVGIMIYIILSAVFRVDSFNYVKQSVKEFISKKMR